MIGGERLDHIWCRLVIEIDVVGEIVTAVRKAPSNSPIFVLEGDDPSQMAFFVGTQAQILAKLNAVQ